MIRVREVEVACVAHVPELVARLSESRGRKFEFYAASQRVEWSCTSIERFRRLAVHAHKHKHMNKLCLLRVINRMLSLNLEQGDYKRLSCALVVGP